MKVVLTFTCVVSVPLEEGRRRDPFWRDTEGGSLFAPQGPRRSVPTPKAMDVDSESSDAPFEMLSDSVLGGEFWIEALNFAPDIPDDLNLDHISAPIQRQDPDKLEEIRGGLLRAALEGQGKLVSWRRWIKRKLKAWMLKDTNQSKFVTQQSLNTAPSVWPERRKEVDALLIPLNLIRSDTLADGNCFMQCVADSVASTAIIVREKLSNLLCNIAFG